MVDQPSPPLTSEVPPPGTTIINTNNGKDFVPSVAHRGFHVNTGSAIKFQSPDDSIASMVVIAGHYYPYPVKKIFATGTDITGYLLK